MVGCVDQGRRPSALFQTVDDLAHNPVRIQYGVIVHIDQLIALSAGGILKLCKSGRVTSGIYEVAALRMDNDEKLFAGSSGVEQRVEPFKHGAIKRTIEVPSTL